MKLTIGHESTEMILPSSSSSREFGAREAKGENQSPNLLGDLNQVIPNPEKTVR